jgi:predicted transcriptional regulator
VKPVSSLRLLDSGPEAERLKLASELFHRLNRLIPEDQQVLTVTLDEPVRDVVSLMAEHNYSCVPVIDELGIMRGVFSLEAFAKRAARGTLDDWKRDQCAPGDWSVSEVIEHFRFAHLDSEMDAVFDSLEKDDAVLAGSRERLVGILTPIDVLKYLYQSPDASVQTLAGSFRAPARSASGCTDSCSVTFWLGTAKMTSMGAPLSRPVLRRRCSVESGAEASTERRRRGSVPLTSFREATPGRGRRACPDRRTCTAMLSRWYSPTRERGEQLARKRGDSEDEAMNERVGHHREDTSQGPGTVDSLHKDLTALGVKEGMIVLVHSSLSSLGWVCGGAVSVVLALEQALGHGTLVMPTHSGDLSGPAKWMNPAVPEAWWPSIRDTMPAYDPLLTPARGVGTIPEVFRRQTGVRRSLHPNYSFAAWGRENGYVTSGE